MASPRRPPASSTVGTPSQEIMSIQYYLRNPLAGPQITASRPTMGTTASGIPATTGSDTNAFSDQQQQQAAAVQSTIQSARLKALKEKYPTYNAFQLDMTLYHEDQEAKERNRRSREEVSLKKEQRLAARLKAIDSLVSLPKLLDAESGKSAPVDKKALKWLQQYHPQVAAKWATLIGLSHTVNAPILLSRKYEESDETYLERLAAAEAEMEQDQAAHAKHKREHDDAMMARILWFRGDKEKKMAKAEERRCKEAQEREKIAKQHEKHRLAVIEKHQQEVLQNAADAAEKRDADLSVHRERVEEARKSDLKARNAIAKRQRALQRERDASLERTRAAEDARRQQESASKDLRHAELMEDIDRAARERREGLSLNLQKCEKVCQNVEQTKREISTYLTRVHSEQEAKVSATAEKIAEERQKKVFKGLRDTKKHTEIVSHRREHELQRLQAHAAEFGSTPRRRCSENEDVGEAASPSSPRYLRPLGCISEGRRLLVEHASTHTQSPKSPRSAFGTAMHLVLDEDASDAESLSSSVAIQHQLKDDVTYQARLREQETYDANLKKLAAKQREVDEAEKRRKEVIDVYVKAPASARSTHELEVLQRCKSQEAKDRAAAIKSLKQSCETLSQRVFIPRPPKLSESSPRSPKPRPVDERALQHEIRRQNLSPPVATVDREAVEERETRAAQAAERRMKAEESEATKRTDQHATQTAKEAAAEKLRLESLRHAQEAVRYQAEAAAVKAEKRRDQLDADSKRPKTLQHSARAVGAATSRSEQHFDGIREAMANRVSTHRYAAEERRTATLLEKEERVHDDVASRQQRHAALYHLQ